MSNNDGMERRKHYESHFSSNDMAVMGGLLTKLFTGGYANHDMSGIPQDKTPEERLAYYRSHGLVHCGDYPGGDKQFERDVLSGEQRDEGIYYGGLKHEDAYVIQAMKDKRFVPDHEFIIRFNVRPHVKLAYWDYVGFRGDAVVSFDYPGGYERFRKDVLGCEYGLNRGRL